MKKRSKLDTLLDFPNIQNLFYRFEELTTKDFTNHIGICSCQDCHLRREALDEVISIIKDEDDSDTEALYDKIADLKLENRKLKMHILSIQDNMKNTKEN